MPKPKYPDIHVKLSDMDYFDADLFDIIERVARALRNNDVSEEEIEEFRFQAAKSDFFTMINKVIAWVDTDIKDDPHAHFFYT